MEPQFWMCFLHFLAHNDRIAPYFSAYGLSMTPAYEYGLIGGFESARSVWYCQNHRPLVCAMTLFLTSARNKQETSFDGKLSSLQLDFIVFSPTYDVRTVGEMHPK